MKTLPRAKKTSARIFSLESNGKQKRGVPSPFDTILNQSEHIWMNNKQGRHFLTLRFWNFDFSRAYIFA